MKPLRFLAVLCTCGGTLAACGQSPTLDLAPDRARKGEIIESGTTNRGVITYGSGSLTSTSTPTVPGDGTGTVDDCTAGLRGVITYGSGSLAGPEPCAQ